MHFIRSFCKRITDDLKQKKLIPLKILFFVHASTLFVLYPYLTIHMRELGINVEETAIMSAVTPVVSIVMPPLAGMVADKIGNFRLLLALTSVLGGASALLLLAVPVGRLTITFPTNVELLAKCDGVSLSLSPMRDFPCTPLNTFAQDVNVTVQSCGFFCTLPEDMTMKEQTNIINNPSYDVRLHYKFDEQSILYRHSVQSHTDLYATPLTDQRNSRILNNDPYINSTITKISNKTMFFPTPSLYRFDCSDAINSQCIFGNQSTTDDLGIDDTRAKAIQMRLTANNDGKDFVVSAINRNENNYDGDDGSVTCDAYFNKTTGIKIHIGSHVLTSCGPACVSLVPRKSLCENKQQQIELDPSFTFWTYLAVRVFIGIIGGTAFAMFEGAVIAIVRDQNADYGLQRLYGSIGGMISSPLSGLLIDYASRGKGYTDFRPAFYLYAVLKMASGILMLSIDLEFKQPAQNLLKDVISVFKNVEIVALFIACFIMGTAWGYIESFLFWLLQDLGASRSLMGITITVGGIAGLPLLVLSGPIIRKLGHANVIFIGFVFYAIRLMGYSLIYNPWLCLIFEALESVTSSLSFTAAVTYAAKLSSTTTDTSVQGLLGGLYYGVGKGSGSLIGGYLMKFFGTRPTYQIFSAATLMTGCIYFIFSHLFIRKKSDLENDSCVKDPKALDIECKDTCQSIAVDECKSVQTVDSDIKSVDDKSLDNTEGGSDSGIENAAFSDTEHTQDTNK